MFILRDLRKISVLGMGLLGASITLRILRSLSNVKSFGYSHRASTRKKARQNGVADIIVDDMVECVTDADMVILATPICTFEGIFKEIRERVKDGCIVTDVGSVKVLPHKWGEKIFGKRIHYVGSHPIAGSEKRGVEFARDDLFVGLQCIVTKTAKTNARAFATTKKFWAELGCKVSTMSPGEHDKTLASVSHVPHVTAVALINATSEKDIKYAGKGLTDTTRIASGAPSVWMDILLTNSDNTARGIDRVIKELTKLKTAVKNKNAKHIEELLSKAKRDRDALINYKIKKKELF